MKKKRTLYNTGKDYFDFDILDEQNKYDYLCFKDAKKAKKKKLDKKFWFAYYREWEKYIREKYQSYDNDKLNEFGRYLNQLIRSREPKKDYMYLLIPVLLAEIVRIMLDYGTQFDFQTSDWSITPWLIALRILIIIFICIRIRESIFIPMFETSCQQHMLNDYKEIIDNMIYERKKTEMFITISKQ